MLFSDWDQSSEYKDTPSRSPTLRSSHSCHHCLRGTQLVRQQTYNGRLCNVQTSKSHYRKFKTDISRKGIARPQSQIPHSCVFPPSVCLFCYRKICGLGLILGIYKSFTDTWTWGNWDWGRTIPYLGIHKCCLHCIVTVYVTAIIHVEAICWDPQQQSSNHNEKLSVLNNVYFFSFSISAFYLL